MPPPALDGAALPPYVCAINSAQIGPGLVVKRPRPAAVAAGVTAYIVAGLSNDRIRPILDVAMARFQHEQALRQELADTKSELSELNSELHDRKVIDRAKGMLMARQSLTEQAAYDKLRKTAMDKNLKVAEVAQRMLDVVDLLT